jgi:MoxR-like ATPase
VTTDQIEKFASRFDAVASNVERVIQGKREAVELVLLCLFAEGHVLIEDVPGVGKTLLAKSMARSIDCTFNRIQFTPDLLPSDVTGVSIWDRQASEFVFKEGAIFANVVVGDEINRASPKTQAALLEAMQERQVSLGSDTYKLDAPYFVIATQNPIEQEGTYPLPEAQLDRFLMKLLIRFPTEEEVLDIVARTTGADEAEVQAVATGEDIIAAGQTIRQMPVADFVARYAVRLVFATHPESDKAPAAVRRYVKCGASPRAAQSVILVGKFFALLDGRMNVAIEDIQRAAFPCLRHRVLLNFDAIADDATSDTLLEQILHEIPRPKGK